MPMLTIEIPESVLLSSGQSREDFVRDAKFLLAAKMFELGRLSSGKAAEICGMHRVAFLMALGRMGIPAVDFDEDEARRELADA